MIYTDKHLAHQLRSSLQELYGITADLDSYYFTKIQPKKKYGTYQVDEQGRLRYRKLCVSRTHLKRLQEKINTYLQKIQLPNYAYGSVKERSNILNARQHVNSRYFLSIDLKNHFPNINHRQVFDMFRSNKFSPCVSRILTQLTTYKGGLPQGPPTSPLIANLVFVGTGKRLLDAIKDHDIIFTTYLDDLTFSSKKGFKFLIPTLLQIIKEGGFILNHKKISYKVDKAEVTGVIIYQNKLWPTVEIKRKAEVHPEVVPYIKSIYKANRKQAQTSSPEFSKAVCSAIHRFFAALRMTDYQSLL
jgi:RNA-directed DNA polymerase